MVDKSIREAYYPIQEESVVTHGRINDNGQCSLLHGFHNNPKVQGPLWLRRNKRKVNGDP